MKFLAPIVFCVALFCSPIAKADPLDFNGTATFGCSITVCAPESFDVSFVWDSTSGVVPNTMLFVASGPLGPFTFTSDALAGEEQGIFNWIDPNGDYFQIYLIDETVFYEQSPDHLLNYVTQSGGTVQIPNGGAFYLQAVDWPGYPNQPPIYAYDNMGSGYLTITDLSDLVTTPEPSALMLSLFGIAAVLCYRPGARRRRTRAGTASI